jgi:hypothetical protein
MENLPKLPWWQAAILGIAVALLVAILIALLID